MFAILGDLTAARVLDLYGGSGALGLEALSRGATHVTFVEASRRGCACIAKNLAQLGRVSHGTVLCSRVERARPALTSLGPFDLVLCDPPWPELDTAVHALARLLPGLLAPEAQVVLEHPAKQEPVLPGSTGLQLRDRRTWGDSGASFFDAISYTSPDQNP